MNKKLQKYLSQLDLLNEREIDYSVSLFENATLKKNDFFISERTVCTQIGSILEGSVRAYSTDENGEENIACFKFENQFIASYDSFTSSRVAKISTHAIENCEM